MDVGRIIPGSQTAGIESAQIIISKNTRTDNYENGENKSLDERKIDKREVKSAVDKANKVLFKNNTHLQFEVHEVTKDVMVRIIDDETGEVLKEIPPEKILDMVAKLWEIAGIFVDEKR